MAVTYTENYHLGKQENLADKFDMSVITQNMDTIDAELFKKVEKENGKGLSSNDYTDTEKEAVGTIGGKASAAELAAHTENTGLHVTAEERASWAETKEQAALNRSTLGYQRKNLLPQTANATTVSGVTFTPNSDGSWTASGTATAVISFKVSDMVKAPPAGTYIYTCSPEGGSTSTYCGLIRNYDSEGNSLVDTLFDTGAGVNIAITDDNYINAVLRINSGVTVDNLVFKPMLRYAEITDDTYEPYVPSVEEKLAELEARLAALEGGE